VRLPVTALMFGALVLGAGACGGSSSGGSGGTNGGGQSDQPAAVQHPKALVGEVGKNDAYAISLSDDQGNPIANLAAGTYKLTVHDDSSIHDFHLAGSGVSVLTSIGDKAVKTYTVTFKPGTYNFLCDPHASQMNGHFTVS
jgi:Copper binding proteins, plastocyanin/azurin family